MLQIDQLARTARRCRMVNRAFGCALSPLQIAQLLPDEDVDLLLELDAHALIDDPLSQLLTLLPIVLGRQ